MLEFATLEDHPAIVDLVNLAYRGGGDVDSWNTEADIISGPRVRLDQLRADLAKAPSARLLVHRDDGGAVQASVWLEPVTEHTWYLGMLAIDPRVQATGLGRRMLAACEAHVTANGGKSMRMTVVNVRATLIAWYERRGYVRTGAVEPFPYDDNRLGTPLRDDLHFVILAKNII